jgi:hypothetical protein
MAPRLRHAVAASHRHGESPAGNIRLPAASHELGRPESQVAISRPPARRRLPLVRLSARSGQQQRGPPQNSTGAFSPEMQQMRREQSEPHKADAD